jgi:hypothetical protein
MYNVIFQAYGQMTVAEKMSPLAEDLNFKVSVKRNKVTPLQSHSLLEVFSKLARKKMKKVKRKKHRVRLKLPWMMTKSLKILDLWVVPQG